MSSLDEHDLLTITEAAHALGGVTCRTVYRYIRSGELAAVRHAGRTYVTGEQIREYFARKVAKGDRERARLEKLARAAVRP